jgi:hypothetical protein
MPLMPTPADFRPKFPSEPGQVAIGSDGVSISLGGWAGRARHIGGQWASLVVADAD